MRGELGEQYKGVLDRQDEQSVGNDYKQMLEDAARVPDNDNDKRLKR